MRIVFTALFALLLLTPLLNGVSFAQSVKTIDEKISPPPLNNPVGDAKDNKAQKNNIKNIDKKTIPAEEPDETSKFWTHGSLMIDKTTLNWIKEAIKAHEQQIPIEILLPSLFPSKEDSTKKETPKIDNNMIDKLLKPANVEASNFYLKSILYFSSDNWSIWLNNNKISDKTAQDAGDISVTKVMGNEAILLWQKSEIDKIFPNWKAQFISIGDNKFTSVDKNIVIDSTTGNISFILKPNQTLVSKTLEIVEGAPVSVVHDNTKKTPDVSADKNFDKNIIPASPEPKAAGGSSTNAIDDGLKNIELLKSTLDQNVKQLK